MIEVKLELNREELKYGEELEIKETLKNVGGDDVRILAAGRHNIIEIRHNDAVMPPKILYFEKSMGPSLDGFATIKPTEKITQVYYAKLVWQKPTSDMRLMIGTTPRNFDSSYGLDAPGQFVIRGIYEISSQYREPAYWAKWKHATALNLENIEIGKYLSEPRSITFSWPSNFLN